MRRARAVRCAALRGASVNIVCELASPPELSQSLEGEYKCKSLAGEYKRVILVSALQPSSSTNCKHENLEQLQMRSHDPGATQTHPQTGDD